MASQNNVAINLPKLTIYLNLLDAIDMKKEIERLNLEKENILNELNRAKGMLSNEKFVSKAPEKLVNSEKEKIIKYNEMLINVEKRIEELS